MNSFLRDLRYAARQLKDKPGFSFTAVGSLALGIAATAAIFSVVYAVVMNPYPYRAPDRMVHLGVSEQYGQEDGVGLTQSQWKELRTSPVIEDSFMTNFGTLTLTGRDLPEEVAVTYMSSNGFQNENGSPPFLSPRLSQLATSVAHGDSVALARFWQDAAGHTPLVEKDPQDDRLCLVTFLWHGDSETKWVGMVGGFRGNGQNGFERLEGTDLWYYTQHFPRDARFGYALNDSGRGYRRDPLNPKFISGLSVVELPGAQSEPWLSPISGLAKGALSRKIFHSPRLDTDRPVGVYTPEGFDPKNGPYDLLIVFDGEDFGDRSDAAVPTHVILDNLIGSLKIPPVVAILVDNLENRDGDLLCSSNFEDFLADELVPWAESNYHTSNDPEKIMVAGASYGGLAAACTAYRHPEVFGNVISLSGTFSYYPGWNLDTRDFGVNSNWLAQRLASGPKLPIKFFLSIGRFEGGPVWSLLRENRRFRDVLVAKGYQVGYWEYSGNHDALTWRDALADGLIYLVGQHRLDWLQ